MPPVAATALLERDAELDRLDAVLARARGGSGTVVLLSGEAGIGKSSLVGAWLDRLAGTDVRVLEGWCDDFLTGRTLGPLRDVARTAGGALAGAVEAADTSAVLDAVLELLDDPLRPVVLVLEDVHWADEATLDVVRFVGRRLRGQPAVLVLTFRDELDEGHPLTSVLGALATAPVERVAPAPLSHAAIAALLGEDGPDTARVAEVTGGNPFFVTEVARTPGEAVPATVADAVLARARRLSDAPRRALQLLSVMPGTVDTEVAGAVVGDLTLLAPAERRGLLVVDGHEVRFRHELARRAVEGSLTAVERVAAHRHVLDVLRDRRHTDPVPMLHHALAAGATDVLVDRGPAALDEAFRVGAHRQAVRLGEQVLPHADRLSPAEQARLLEQHAWAQYDLHDFAGAIASARRAAELRDSLGDPAALARALLTWSRMLYIANHPVAASELFDQALATADGVDDDELAAEVLVHQAQLLVLTDRFDEAGEVAARAVTAAVALGRPDLEVLALNYRGLQRATTGGQVVAGLADLQRAVGIGLEHGLLEPTARSYTNLVEELLRAGRWDEAETAIEEAIAFYDDHDFVAHRYNTVSQRGLLWTWRGRWDEATELFHDLHRSVADAGVLEALALNGLVRLGVWRGDPDLEALVDRAWEVATTSGASQYLTTIGAARIEFAWLNDRPDLVAPTLDLALVPQAPVRHRALILRTLQMAGFDDGITIDPDAYPEPYRSGLRGDWASAAAGWAELGVPYLAALERASSGEVDVMIEALAALDELGALPAGRWLRRRLRDQGVRSIPRGPQAATRDNPAGLTTRQLDVLQLVATGLTNAEIAERLVVSTRTVDHHVSAVLGKLGVATRQEAAAALARLEGR